MQFKSIIQLLCRFDLVQIKAIYRKLKIYIDLHFFIILGVNLTKGTGLNLILWSLYT